MVLSPAPVAKDLICKAASIVPAAIAACLCHGNHSKGLVWVLSMS
jgi:hypothetical protein